MSPIVTIFGNYNVGKSTLFNCLTHSKNALVSNFPGLTVDRQYGFVKYKNYKFIVVDTCTINLKKNNKNINNQSKIALQEANLLLFIVDARIGISLDDINIARFLLRKRKPIIMVINKIDSTNLDNITNYPIGINKISSISALYNKGINKLTKQIITFLKKDKLEVEINCNNKYISSTKDLLSSSTIKKLAIIGCPNVGKSTLANFMSNDKERMLVDYIPGTTRDSISIPISNKMGEYIIIDTAGMRKHNKIKKSVEKLSIMKTLETIHYSQILIFIIDAKKGISNQDLSLLKIILNIGKPFVVAVNKWDSVLYKNKKKIKAILNEKLKFINFAKLNFISAKYGNGINDLFESINETCFCSDKKINSNLLTNIMYDAINKYNPPRINKTYIKLKYAHVGGYNPLIIVIHGNLVKKIPSYYKNYLSNIFRKTLNITGVPIYIKFHQTVNPYISKN